MEMGKARFKGGVETYIVHAEVKHLYTGALMGDPASATFKSILVQAQERAAEEYFGPLPFKHLSLASDTVEGKAIPAYFHMVILSTTQALDYPEVAEEEVDFVDRSSHGFTWLAEDPGFALNELQAGRLAEIDWLREAYLVNDVFGPIKRVRGEG